MSLTRGRRAVLLWTSVAILLKGSAAAFGAEHLVLMDLFAVRDPIARYVAFSGQGWGVALILTGLIGIFGVTRPGVMERVAFGLMMGLSALRAMEYFILGLLLPPDVESIAYSYGTMWAWACVLVFIAAGDRRNLDGLEAP